MGRFTRITRFLPEIEFWSHRSDKGAESEGSISPSMEKMASREKLVSAFFEELSDFMMMHPALSSFDPFEYLEERAVNVRTSDRKYLSKLDLKATLALLFSLVRNERVVPGTLAEAFRTGRVRGYLRRLAELDEGANNSAHASPCLKVCKGY